jgi:hypothetical protein
MGDPHAVRIKNLVETLLMLSKTASLALLGVLLSCGMALAQDQNAAVDPADSLAGLWRTDHAEGSAAASVPDGRLIKISRSSINSFTAGACTNPTFTAAREQKTVKLAIVCLGQNFADAEWSTDNADRVTWKEPDLTVSLERVAMQPVPKPATDNSGGSQ